MPQLHHPDPPRRLRFHDRQRGDGNAIRRLKPIRAVVAAIALDGGVHGAAAAQSRGDEPLARIAIVVEANGLARVHEVIRMPRDTGLLNLQFLARSCADVETASLTVNGLPVSGPLAVNGPWRILRHTATANSSGIEIAYRVRLAANPVDIPIIHPASVIGGSDGGRGPIAVAVELNDGEGSVRFPHLERDADGRTWSGRFVATPSFITIRRSGNTPLLSCLMTGTRSHDGGLTWRFWLWLGIMLAWVPTYLAWARRTSDRIA